MAETQPFPLQALCYTAGEFREGIADQVCGEGVVDVHGGDLLVTTGGSGLNLLVADGSAYVLNNESSGEAQMYRVLNDTSVTLTGGSLPGVLAADATNPRIDTVVATVSDSEYAGGTDTWTLNVVGGNATGGATLANLSGAAAVPDNSVVLAYILVPATFVGPFVNATHILDARNNYFKCGAAPYIDLVASAATTPLTSGAFNKVTLATTVHRDPDYFSVSASVVTILQDGLYDISAYAGFASSTTLTTNTVQSVGIGLGGLAVHLAQNAGSPGTQIYRGAPSTDSVALVATNTIQLNVLPTGAATIATEHNTGAGQVSRLVIRKVG